MGRVARKVGASLHFAITPHLPIRAVTTLRACQSADQLIEDIRVIAQTAPSGEDFVWEDHHDGSSKLWAPDPIPASFEYMAASLRAAAELEVSRDFDPGWVAQRIGAASKQPTRDLWDTGNDRCSESRVSLLLPQLSMA